MINLLIVENKIINHYPCFALSQSSLNLAKHSLGVLPSTTSDMEIHLSLVFIFGPNFFMPSSIYFCWSWVQAASLGADCCFFSSAISFLTLS